MEQQKEKQREKQRAIQKAKEARKKNYSDLLIQGTNNSSIASKRSVENLYSSVLNENSEESISEEWFKFFVKKPQRRSPVINRGYWLRMRCISESIRQIAASSPTSNICVISLGCGFDPLPFKLLSQEPNIKFTFLDIDYPELITNKVNMIQNSPEIMSVIGQVQPTSVEGVQLKTENYACIGCNLRDESLFNRQLFELGIDNADTVKIFIAEVSLAYMLPEYANPIIQNTASYENSHFVILEQLAPAGPSHPFARTMLNHFSRLEHPLKCVLQYPTIEHQLERFRKFFPLVEARDLLGNWKLIPEVLKTKVSAVEAFDEWEEFIMYTQHYIVLHATNTDVAIYPSSTKSILPTPSKTYKGISVTKAIVANEQLLERKFGASTVQNDLIIYTGGMTHNRLNTSVFMSSNPLPEKSFENQITSRMCHSSSLISNNELIIIGGRGAPNKLLDEVYKLRFDQKTCKWIPLSPLSEPRSRHSAVFVLSSSVLLVCGGLAPSSKASSFVAYDVDENTWTDVTSTLPNRISVAMSWYDDFGVLFGGMDDTGVIDSCLYKFKFVNGAVESEVLMKDVALSRYGAKCSFLSEDKLLVVGGVSDNYVLDRYNTVFMIDLVHKLIEYVEIDEETWSAFPMLVGFEIVDYDGVKLCIGGGAVCFGFGSCWNHALAISYAGSKKHIELHHLSEA